MSFDKGFNVLSAIVGVALATTLVAHKQTANIVRAFTTGFGHALLNAQGKAA